MPVAERIESLRAKHTRLETEIDQEAHRPMPDDTHLSRLKREKLRIKDQIIKMAALH